MRGSIRCIHGRGRGLTRWPDEPDDVYRHRVVHAWRFQHLGGRRAGLEEILKLAGVEAEIWEPRDIGDAYEASGVKRFDGTWRFDGTVRYGPFDTMEIDLPNLQWAEFLVRINLAESSGFLLRLGHYLVSEFKAARSVAVWSYYIAVDSAASGGEIVSTTDASGATVTVAPTTPYRVNVKVSRYAEVTDPLRFDGTWRFGSGPQPLKFDGTWRFDGTHRFGETLAGWAEHRFGERGQTGDICEEDYVLSPQNALREWNARQCLELVSRAEVVFGTGGIDSDTGQPYDHDTTRQTLRNPLIAVSPESVGLADAYTVKVMGRITREQMGGVLPNEAGLRAEDVGFLQILNMGSRADPPEADREYIDVTFRFVF